MHAIEEAKGCMQKGFDRLQAKGDTIFRGEIIFGEKPYDMIRDWGNLKKQDVLLKEFLFPSFRVNTANLSMCQ